MCNINICRHLTAVFEAENQSTVAVFLRKRACAHFSTLFRPSLFPGFMSSVFDCNLMDVISVFVEASEDIAHVDALRPHLLFEILFTISQINEWDGIPPQFPYQAWLTGWQHVRLSP